MHRCTECGKERTGKLDTYGDMNFELCWGCYSSEEDWFDAHGFAQLDEVFA